MEEKILPPRSPRARGQVDVEGVCQGRAARQSTMAHVMADGSDNLKQQSGALHTVHGLGMHM